MHIPEDEAERRRLNERGREILRRKNGAVRPHREDGYVNLLNKYGTKQDNSEAYKFEREPVIPDMQLTGLYEGNGLFSKIIDTPAEEALKHGFDLNLKSDELNAFVEDALDDLEWEERAATAIKWARLYGGALIVMLIDDGRGLEEPVDWEHIRSIDELRVYERSIVQPDSSSLYQQDYGGKGVGNRVSKFGQPEYYYVSSIYGSFKVHESRCLVFRNGVLPEQTSNATYLFWGMPEYVRIRRALRETVTAHTDSVKLLERSVQAIYSMKGLASLLTTDDGENQEVLLNSNVTFRLVKKTGKELTFEALWKEKNQDNSFADTALDYENLDADTDYGVGVLVVQDGRFLCGTRQKEGSISGPGGHIEAGESPEDAAIRETQEEFGIKPKGLIPVAFLSDLKPPYCPSHVFLCTDFDGSIRCADGEMTSPGFITAEKVAELSTQNPERLFPPFAQSITALLDVLSSNPGLTSDAQNAKMKDRMDFNEADHPRDENGQFAEGEGSSSGSTESGPAVSPEGENVPCTGFASPARLEDHATRHGLAEMGYATKEEYQQKGIDFLKQPCGGDVIGYARPDGVVVRFNTKTTEYATGVPGGPLKTYMKAKCNRKTGEARSEVAMKYYEFNREKDLKEVDDEHGS